MGAILELTGVSKSYGALKVTDDLSFILEKGEALGVLGPNGAGKSTMFNLIAGGVRPDQGAIRYHGEDVTGLPAAERCVGRSYQIPHPFGGMTVFENLLVGGTFGGDVGESACYDRCADILERTGLLAKANTRAGTLSLLERKRLELARALATDPDLLLLDEIAGGLTEGECRALIETIRSIHQCGVSIIWIEHVVHALMAVAERLIVINFGKLIADGPPAEVMDSAVVKEIYLGIGGDA